MPERLFEGKSRLRWGRKFRRIEIGGQKEDKNQKRNPVTLDFQWVTGFYSAQNRTRTCTPLSTRTWNERVYHSATWASVGFAVAKLCIFFWMGKYFQIKKSAILCYRYKSADYVCDILRWNKIVKNSEIIMDKIWELLKILYNFADSMVHAIK